MSIRRMKILIAVACALAVLGAGASYMLWRLHAVAVADNEKRNEGLCFNNVITIYQQLLFLSDDPHRQQEFFKAVADGEDPIAWMQHTGLLWSFQVVCPPDLAGRRRGAANPHVPPQNLSYATWKWDERLYRNLMESGWGLDVPVVWEKMPGHHGKRMVMWSHDGSPELLPEAEFQKIMGEARESLSTRK